MRKISIFPASHFFLMLAQWGADMAIARVTISAPMECWFNN